MSYSSVRLALVASVTCSRPPVSRNASHESTVPKASSPASARSRAPATYSRIQAILVAEKYGSRHSPVFARTRSSTPARRSSSQAPAVRRSCQTMALLIGSPVPRSQMTVVSRWLVMPTAAIRLPSIRAARSASSATATWVAQISRASCSTHPGRGKRWVVSRCASERMVPRRSKTIARELVVP